MTTADTIARFGRHCRSCAIMAEQLSAQPLAVAQHALLYLAAHQLPPRAYELFKWRIAIALDLDREREHPMEVSP